MCNLLIFLPASFVERASYTLGHSWSIGQAAEHHLTHRLSLPEHFCFQSCNLLIRRVPLSHSFARCHGPRELRREIGINSVTCLQTRDNLTSYNPARRNQGQSWSKHILRRKEVDDCRVLAPSPLFTFAYKAGPINSRTNPLRLSSFRLLVSYATSRSNTAHSHHGIRFPNLLSFHGTAASGRQHRYFGCKYQAYFR